MADYYSLYGVFASSRNRTTRRPAAAGRSPTSRSSRWCSCAAIRAIPARESRGSSCAVLAGPNRQPFQQGSGRLELADAIASPDNPLTARVWVNRVWGHLFGQGLVATPSDFGMRSDPPSHPELLDYLAHGSCSEGWSTKKLIRWIVRVARLPAGQRRSARTAERSIRKTGCCGG